MALHEITIHENTGASKDVAPYLGAYAAKDTVRLDGFAEAVARQCGLPAIQAMAILTGAFDAIVELEQDALVRVHTDLGVVCGVIVGSFPTADAEFDPERNSLCLALHLDDTIRLSLANVVPAIVLDGDVTRVRVDNAADLAQPKPYNLIHGQHVFRVAGHKLVLSDSGASAYLTDAQGTVYPLVIDMVESDQLFRAHTAELLPAGDYRLVVASRGGEADGDLQRPFRRVKYLRVVDPPTGDEPVVTSGHSSGYSDPGMIDPNADFIMGGHNLAGASVRVDWTDEGGNERTQNIPAGETTAEDEEITLQQGDWLEACTTVDGAVLTFTVTTSHGSTTYQATVRA